MLRLASVLLLGLLAACAIRPQPTRSTPLWNLEVLLQTPQADWGSKTGLVQEVYYAGEPYLGKPTRIFAYLGRPATGKGPFPAMLLVHGGGGKAFKDWAEHWAARGYVALAMDTAGQGSRAGEATGGPDQSDATKFRNFSESEVKEMWTYHAIASVLRGHGLLKSLPEVDQARIGVTGISWGGYLTCILAGIDRELKVAVPVYGCGFLGDNSVWKDRALKAMNEDSRALWLQYFDPSQYIGETRLPVLFLNGSNDFAYPLDSYQKTYQLVPWRYRYLSIVLNLPHGHIWTFPEVDAFVDAALRGAQPLPKVRHLRNTGDHLVAELVGPGSIKEAALAYTTNSGPWQTRQWKTNLATVSGRRLTATVPPFPPTAMFFTVVTDQGLRISSEHEGAPGTPPSN